ncbi:MAG: nucleotidyltransferase domain-containing protein [Thaumarchaeota archaeon]|nr:MAG: nucleotidyltransferase domain-containing protein [Candidatus Wolframiiraptor sp.]RLG07003.1 MAG: nucleotidyltransferase domain-containing protein [Nitrososphaerota archaeon]
MPRKGFIDLLIEDAEERKRFFEDFLRYAEKVKEVVRRRDPNARIIVFGSVVRGDVRPDSDIDLLIITDLAEKLDERIKLRMEIMRILGEGSPFEIHIITAEEYENWYRRFIDQTLEL